MCGSVGGQRSRCKWELCDSKYICPRGRACREWSGSTFLQSQLFSRAGARTSWVQFQHILHRKTGGGGEDEANVEAEEEEAQVKEEKEELNLKELEKEKLSPKLV